MSQSHTHAAVSRSHTHTAVSRSHTYTAASRSCTHTAVRQSCTHTAVSRRHTHTAVSRSSTHTTASQSCTHKARRQSHSHTAVSQQLHTLHNLALSSSSSRAYKSGLRRFRQFCKQLKLTALPASKHTVALFAAELSRSVAPRTARVYLAAVSLFHRRAGLRTPTRHNPSLQLALHGMAHYHSSQRAFIRKPITTSILNALLTTVHSTQRWCKHDRAMLRAALCLAFYGFLRGSEFMTPSWGTFNPAIHATPADITSSTSILRFHIKQSKTDQHAFGHTVSLGATGGKQCPVRIIRHYLTHYSTRPQHPLFIRCSGKPLTLQDFRYDLRFLIKRIGLPPEEYNTHSLRIGAATTAAAAGIPVESIKQLGRWRSKAYRSYIRPMGDFTPTTSLLAQHNTSSP